MESHPEGRVKALIVLLADEDSKIARVAQENLIEMGEISLPLLKAFLKEPSEPGLLERLKLCVEKIQTRHLDALFSLYACQEDERIDLETGALLVARVVDPDLDEAAVRSKLDDIAHQIEGRCKGLTEPQAVLGMVNTVLFGELKFTGNQKSYYEPENSFIHKVLERKTGIPISLGVLYLLVARRLGLPVFGVGMPGHFVVKYESPGFETFIDPFNAGQCLNAHECAQFLINLGYGFEPGFLAKVGTREILSRMVRNLISIYATRADRPLEERFGRYLKLLSAPALAKHT